MKAKNTKRTAFKEILYGDLTNNNNKNSKEGGRFNITPKLVSLVISHPAGEGADQHFLQHN